jgi:hypothetical protein
MKGSDAHVGNVDKTDGQEGLDKVKKSLKIKSKLFRGDDYYDGGPIGFELNSIEASAADIQDFFNHVRNKETGNTCRFTSFSTGLKLPGGGGAAKFSKKGKIWKVDIIDLVKLENDGKIRILTPDDVFELMINSGDNRQSNV